MMLKKRMYLQKQRIVVRILTQYNLNMGKYNSNPTFNNGDDIWEKFVSKHDNIVLVLSGHIPSNHVVMEQTEGDAGNTVTQMLVNPQYTDMELPGGGGFVAMLYFSEDGKDVTVRYYSTIQEEYFLQENQFSFTMDTVDDGTTDDGTTDDGTTDVGATDSPSTGDANSGVVIYGVLLILALGAVLTLQRKTRKF